LLAGLETRTEDAVELHLRVEDTGPGIAPQDADAVFRPFVQLDGSATRRHGGIGLGLAIAWDAVETLGGRIWVESAPSVGSTFHVAVHLRCATGAGSPLAAAG
jgi:signal transduction histidine kinase